MKKNVHEKVGSGSCIGCRKICAVHWKTRLQQTGQPLEGAVNAMTLSGSLERQLSEFAAAPAASAVVRVALLSLHAFIDHLR